jgi:hypothetical protein
MALYVGEVIQGYPPVSPKNRYKNRYEYDVRVYLSQGEQIITNVRFVGDSDDPDDFTEIILRGSKDNSGKGNQFPSSVEESRLMAGSRVLIAVPGDRPNFFSAFIVGTIPHDKNTAPMNTDKNTLKPAIREENAKPQYRNKRNGIFQAIDGFGQYRLQYNGLSTVKPNTEPLNTLPTVSDYGQMTIDLLQKSVLRISDSNGQAIAVDSFNKFISLNNTTTPPKNVYGEADSLVINEVSGTGTPKGQEVRLDTGGNTLYLRSAGSLMAISENYYAKNDTCKVDSKDVNINDGAGAALKIKGGKVSLGTSSAEVVDLAIQHIDALLQNAPQLVLTVVGPGQLNPAVVTLLTKIKALLTTIKQ